MVTPRKPAPTPPQPGEQRSSGPGEKLRTVYSLSEDETCDLGRTVARNFKGGELLLLEGDLGLGKTVFARGVARGLGISSEAVSSPSFTLVQEYRGRTACPMFHIDLYRLERRRTRSESLGLDEILEPPAAWSWSSGARRLPHALPPRGAEHPLPRRRRGLTPHRVIAEPPRTPKTGRGDA